MSSPRIVYDDGSYDIINFTLQKVDVFHCSELPIDLVKTEVLGNAKNSNRKYQQLRYDWLYGPTGLIPSLVHQSTFLSRLVSLYDEGDKPYTLRHKVNITNTLLDTDFNTNLPLHVSIGRDENFELDTNLDIKSIAKGYRVIIHPGHTRAVGSLFLNTPLKNCLIYINKDLTEQINIKQYDFLTKIETPEELIKHYRPLRETNSGKLIYNFKMGGKAHDIIGNKKVHIQNNTPILKASSIKSSDNAPAKNLHSSPSYIDETFRSFNNLLNLIVGKKINVFTDSIHRAETIELKKRSALFNSGHNADIMLKDEPSKYRNSGKPFVSIARDPFTRFTNSITSFDKRELNIFKKFSNFFQESMYEITQDYDFMPLDMFRYHKLPENIDYSSLVEFNNHKGLVFIIRDHENLNRLLLEYLFLINKDVCLAKSADDKVVIINCEHDHWIGDREYKEWIIPGWFEKVENGTK